MDKEIYRLKLSRKNNRRKKEENNLKNENGNNQTDCRYSQQKK